jgi:hypothetical protein
MDFLPTKEHGRPQSSTKSKGKPKGKAPQGKAKYDAENVGRGKNVQVDRSVFHPGVVSPSESARERVLEANYKKKEACTQTFDGNPANTWHLAKENNWGKWSCCRGLAASPGCTDRMTLARYLTQERLAAISVPAAPVQAPTTAQSSIDMAASVVTAISVPAAPAQAPTTAQSSLGMAASVEPS